MESRVLVLAPLGHDARLVERVLDSVGISSAACAGAQELAVQLEAGAGALLVSEEALGDAVMAVLARFVKAQPAWSDLPVLVLAKRGADSVLAQRAVEHLGNVTMLERPIRTITLITAARSALRARTRQYEMRALNRRKDEFLATLAHELRNPLAPIRNATAVLERLHPTPQVSAMAGMVERQVRHLTRLVDDLLDVARITSGKMELQLVDTSVERVVTHALEIAQAQVNARGQELVARLPPGGDVPLRADHVRLVQVLANLLVNASKFTPAGGHIALEAATDGADVQFIVRDDGRGLEPDALERIFDMFEQAHGVGEPTGGLGLGLHLARAFARMHGGTIHARSAGLGAGSEFVLRLPVVHAAREQAGRRDGAARRSLPGKVLVVDDNVDAAMTLQTLLALHGMDVSVAHDGAAAIARVRAEQPRAVVMDIGMPVMNGYEAAQRIRAGAAGVQPLLIALTGWGQEVDRLRAREAGFDHHLVKPLNLEQLLDCLAEAAVET